jgi:hypothetical protein
MEPLAVDCVAADEETTDGFPPNLRFRSRGSLLLLGRPGSSTRLVVLSMFAMVIRCQKSPSFALKTFFSLLRAGYIIFRRLARFSNAISEIVLNQTNQTNHFSEIDDDSSSTTTMAFRNNQVRK